MFCVVNPSEPSVYTMATPATVTAAMATPTFYQDAGQFWNMLDYLFTKHRQIDVWQHLPPATMHQVGIQTQHAIEAALTFNILESRKTQLYQLYFAVLHKVKGGKPHSRFLYDSSPDFLQSIYRLYKLLRQLNFNMPAFGQVQ